LPTGPCVLLFSRYPRRDSNPQAPGFKPGRSASWRTRATSPLPLPFQSKPIRGQESNLRPPGSKPGVTANSNCPGAEAVGLEPTNGFFHPPPVFETGSSSSRSTSVSSVFSSGGRNRTCGLLGQNQASLPTATAPERKPWDSNPQTVSAATRFRDGLLVRPVDFRFKLFQFRGQESNLRPPGSEPGVTTSSNCPGIASHTLLTLACEFRFAHSFKSALRELNPPVRFGRPVPQPLGQGHISLKAEGGGVEPSGRALARVQDGCHRQLACPSKKIGRPLSGPYGRFQLRRQESNLRQLG
jgi:hypothetical protein